MLHPFRRLARFGKRVGWRRALIIIAALAVLEIGGVLVAFTAFADSIMGTSCVFSGGLVNCVRQWRGSHGATDSERLQGQDKRAQAEAIERERKWVARCKPVIRQDQYGVSRYHYAKPGCEFGKHED
jgi:hypothetical protein